MKRKSTRRTKKPAKTVLGLPDLLVRLGRVDNWELNASRRRPAFSSHLFSRVELFAVTSTTAQRDVNEGVGCLCHCVLLVPLRAR